MNLFQLTQQVDGGGGEKAFMYVCVLLLRPRTTYVCFYEAHQTRGVTVIYLTPCRRQRVQLDLRKAILTSHTVYHVVTVPVWHSMCCEHI